MEKSKVLLKYHLAEIWKKRKTANWTVFDDSGNQSTIEQLAEDVDNKSIVIKLDGYEYTENRKKIVNKVNDDMKLVSIFYTEEGKKTHSTEIGYDIVE